MIRNRQKIRGQLTGRFNSRLANLSKPDHVIVHQGETEAEWSARTGKAPTKCPPGIVDGAVNPYAAMKLGAFKRLNNTK